MSALDSHQRGDLVFFVYSFDVVYGECHRHQIGMAGCLFVDRINQVQRALCEMALVRFGVDPDGEELCSQISSSGLFEADVVFVFGVCGADVIVLIEKTLGRVLVRVNDEGGALYTASARADWSVLRKTKN